jgi:ribosomal protein S18 acetylase RimI-like enzyme
MIGAKVIRALGLTAPSDGRYTSGVISVQHQPFESDILGGPVLRLVPDGPVQNPALDHALNEAGRLGVPKLVTARIDDLDRAGARLLEAREFRRVETLVTLARPTEGGEAPELAVERAGPDSAPECAAIARVAFTHDRFHADTRLDRAAADEIKARWAANGVTGRADAALVVRQGGRIVGFNLCLLAGSEAVIDLIAVAPAAHGQGIGRSLVLAALAHYRPLASTLRVGTQASNLASLALYRRLGFAERNRAQTFHLVKA